MAITIRTPHTSKQHDLTPYLVVAGILVLLAGLAYIAFFDNAGISGGGSTSSSETQVFTDEWLAAQIEIGAEAPVEGVFTEEWLQAQVGVGAEDPQPVFTDEWLAAQTEIGAEAPVEPVFTDSWLAAQIEIGAEAPVEPVFTEEWLAAQTGQ